MPVEKFPQSKDYELSLLLKGDSGLKGLKAYMRQYIRLALGKFDMPKKRYDEIFEQLMDDVETAAWRYLHNDGPKKSFKFSAYFSWYVKERINKGVRIKRKAGQ